MLILMNLLTPTLLRKWKPWTSFKFCLSRLREVDHMHWLHHRTQMKLVQVVNRSYPCNEEKQMLAESVVTLFPSLKIKMGEENEGFEHFYDPVSHSGFIEMRLRNLRRKLHDDQRR